MVSFDVTALFTSINLDLAKRTLNEILPEHFKSGKLTKFSVCKLVNLCFTTQFEFNGTLCVPREAAFRFSDKEHFRGHEFKLEEKRCRLDI